MREALDHRYSSEKHATTKERYLQDMNRFFAPILNENILPMDEYDWAKYMEKCVERLNPKRKAFNNACSLLRLTLKTLKNQKRLDINISSIVVVCCASR